MPPLAERGWQSRNCADFFVDGFVDSQNSEDSRGFVYSLYFESLKIRSSITLHLLEGDISLCFVMVPQSRHNHCVMAKTFDSVPFWSHRIRGEAGD